MTEKKLRIAHVTLARFLTAGQRKQLNFEHQAAAWIDAEWNVLALNCSYDVANAAPFEQGVPRLLRPLMLRHLYAWYRVWKLSKTHDFVLMRHLGFDLFAYAFASVIKNRLSVHHTKEIEELPYIRAGWKGRVAAWLEVHTGRFAIARARAVLGVTRDIAKYETIGRGIPEVPYFTFPNGINLTEVSLAADERDPKQVNVVFICGTFAPWHGLDRLIKAIEDESSEGVDFDELKIHLIGKLCAEQIGYIKSSDRLRKVISIHGTMTLSQYAPIVARCDIALASLAMDRQNLREGATLKVREMLAMGIPLYSTHSDTALPIDFPYFHIDKDVNVRSLLSIAVGQKKISREEVRRSSAPYISKAAMMQNVCEWIKERLSYDD